MCLFNPPEQRWRADLDCQEGVEGEGTAPVIEGGNENTNELEQFVAAKFHFVDLAGSERVNKTGNKGERFKGDVITLYLLLHVQW